MEKEKQIVTNSKELPGATLIVKDKDGKTKEKWVSTDKPHMIEKLPIGTYTLTEITAPKGYDVAETVTFEVEDTGAIQHVVMYDQPTPPETEKVTPPPTGDDLNMIPARAEWISEG